MLLENSTQGIRASYLLIVEWLADGEAKTGTRLYGALSDAGVSVRLAVCSTGQDVLRAIDQAAEQIKLDEKYPVIQLEAHGNEYGIGPATNGADSLSWAQLSGPLRKVNLATRFNLLVIGAACYGLSSATTFDVEHASPFTLAIGFSSKVNSGRLYEAMRELHRGLFSSVNKSGGEILASANRELKASEGEQLRATGCVAMGALLLRLFIAQDIDPAKQDEHVDRLLERLRETHPDTTREVVISSREALAIPSVESVVAKWFAYDLLPENRNRFTIDVAAMYAGTRADELVKLLRKKEPDLSKNDAAPFVANPETGVRVHF